MHPAFGGFMTDPTAQMGFQVGKSAVMAGQDYVEQNVCGEQGGVCEGVGQADRSTTVQPLRECLGSQTLLQRLQRLCDPETVYCALPMAT